MSADERLRSVEFTSDLAQRLSAGDDLRRAIENFRPLPFNAGEQATRWLQDCLSAGNVPVETQLLFGADPAALLGFYVVRPLAFDLRSLDDQVKLEVRLLAAHEEMHDDPQPGTLIELIARSADTAPGFGEHLIDHVLASTMEKGSVAVLIEPDNATTDALFRKRYRFMEFDEPAVPGRQLKMLWHPVHDAVGGWPS